jgi:hypothetical protein
MDGMTALAMATAILLALFLAAALLIPEKLS